MKRSILPALLAAVLVLSGCGASEDDEAKTAISDYLMEQQADDQMITLEQGEADCISEGMVDGIGVDKLKEYGFLKEDGTVNENAETPEMAQGDAETMVDSMFDCTDVMATMQDELAKSMGDQPAEVKDCFEEALTGMGGTGGSQNQRFETGIDSDACEEVLRWPQLVESAGELRHPLDRLDNGVYIRHESGDQGEWDLALIVDLFDVSPGSGTETDALDHYQLAV